MGNRIFFLVMTGIEHLNMTIIKLVKDKVIAFGLSPKGNKIV